MLVLFLYLFLFIYYLCVSAYAVRMYLRYVELKLNNEQILKQIDGLTALLKNLKGLE